MIPPSTSGRGPGRGPCRRTTYESASLERLPAGMHSSVSAGSAADRRHSSDVGRPADLYFGRTGSVCRRGRARQLPHATVSCTYLDLYRANLAKNYWHDAPVNMRIVCAADLPDEEADVVAFPFSAGGEAELTRDLIQAGHERLRIGGKMYATTDNPSDTWLHSQLGNVFSKLQRQSFSAGMLYVGTKTEPLKKIKNFSCEFAFRDRGRLIRAYSRPGVFSHRHIDPGARRLIERNADRARCPRPRYRLRRRRGGARSRLPRRWRNGSRRRFQFAPSIVPSRAPS